MANPIITKRLEKFEAEKRSLLKKKKSERNGRLKKVNETISRLKKWNHEEEVRLSLKVPQIKKVVEITPQKNPEVIQDNVMNINKCLKAYKEISEANPQWCEDHVLFK